MLTNFLILNGILLLKKKFYITCMTFIFFTTGFLSSNNKQKLNQKSAVLILSLTMC